MTTYKGTWIKCMTYPCDPITSLMMRSFATSTTPIHRNYLGNSITLFHICFPWQFPTCDIINLQGNVWYTICLRWWDVEHVGRFLRKVAFNPVLTYYQGPIPILLDFDRRYHDTTPPTSKHQVRSRTVEGAIWNIGQTISMLAPQDPCLIHQGCSNGIRLRYLYHCYDNTDNPPFRAKPALLQVILRIDKIITYQQSEWNTCITKMILLDYFLLICPDEYMRYTKEYHPFHLWNGRLYCGGEYITILTPSPQISRLPHSTC